MKKVLKITIILLILLIVQLNMNSVWAVRITSYEENDGSTSIVPEITQLSGILGEDLNNYKPDPNDDDSIVYDKAANVLEIIRTIGFVVSVLSLMGIGIKTMFLSAEEKATYKQALPGYILGAIMVLAITWIPTLIYNLINS